MGYHLPGFGLLGPEKHYTHSNLQKKVKDPRNQRLPSASSPSAAAVPAVSLTNDKAFWQKWKQELRPLLNSIRFVESNSLRYGDSCGVAIGPFQISRQYHHDAWKHAPSFASAASWSRCRDLSHAENTVIAYWLKHCPEAVEKRDFEVLTKVHNGGPQGLQREKTEYYWKQVSKHLREQEMAKMKENMLFKQSPLREHSKQDDSNKASPSPLSSIVSNTITARKALSQKHECNRPSSITVPKKLMENLKPKVLDTQHEGESKNNIKLRNAHKVDQEVCKSASKRSHPAKFYLSKGKCERVFLRNALTEDYRKERAALKIQTFWRMLYVKRRYRRLQTATRSIQKAWRRHFYVLPNTENKCHYTIQQDETNAEVSLKTEECTKSVKSPCELLYSNNISAKQEDALLTELARLLKLDTGDANGESCHNFQFPRSEMDDENEVSTPKMKTEVNWRFEAASPSNFATDCSTINDTPLAIKDALPSPFTEKSIVDELTKLFPCRLQLAYHEDPSDASSLGFANGGNGHNDKNIRRYMESPERIKPIGFDNDDHYPDNGINAGMRDSLTRQNYSFESNSISEYASSIRWNMEPDNINRIKGTTRYGYEIPHEKEEELSNIPIPLLQDQSPVVKSKAARRRNPNPCTRKVERALISSLSEWQSSRSFKGKQVQNSGIHITGSSIEHKEFCASNALYRCCPQEEQMSEAICKPNGYLDNSHLDYLLETNAQDSTVYAKAVFQCLSISIEELKFEIPTRSEIRPVESSEGSDQQNSTTLLRHLCMLWDKNDVDLLTRSLKYKSLDSLNFDDDLCRLNCLHSEIQLLEKSSEMSNDLQGNNITLHQRNTIYSNIMSSCDREEKHRLCTSWGMEKHLSDCLEKIVYELLWTDPQRYSESAELVFKYL